MSKNVKIGALLFATVCLSIIAILFEMRQQQQLVTPTPQARSLDFASLPGLWNGTWVGPHHGTLSINVSSTGSYTAHVLGGDVEEHGTMSGTIDQAGNLNGMYTSPTLGRCIVSGQIYTIASNHNQGFIKFFSAPKLEKTSIQIDITK